MFLTELTQTALRWEAQESAPREVCGFVLLDGSCYAIDNINQNDGEWKMDYEQSVAFRREHVGMIVGTYHTHPKGSIMPSLRDRMHCPVKYLMWIVTPTEVWRWMRYDEGEWVGVYEPAFSALGLPGCTDGIRPEDQTVAVLGSGGRGLRLASIAEFDKTQRGDVTLAAYVREEGHAGTPG